MDVTCIQFAHVAGFERPDHTGSHLPCACGAQAQYRGRHGKSFESVLGTLHLERAYYYCQKCQSGFCPRDRALSLEDFSLFPPAVLRMVGSAATLVSFVETSTLLRELAGVDVNAKQVERAAEALGQEIDEDERQCVEPLSETPVPATLYLGMDGTGIPLDLHRSGTTATTPTSRQSAMLPIVADLIQASVAGETLAS